MRGERVQPAIFKSPPPTNRGTALHMIVVLQAKGTGMRFLAGARSRCQLPMGFEILPSCPAFILVASHAIGRLLVAL